MSLKSKKFIALFLVFSLMAISCTTMTTQKQKRFEFSIERKHGAKLTVIKKDGRLIEGELITVKPNSLLLLDTEGKDVSVSIADIKVIRVMKKSKVLLGAGIGSGAGTLGGIIFAAYCDVAYDQRVEFLAYAVLGAIGLGVGALVGALIGAAAGRDETIYFFGMSDSEIQDTLNKLRKKARIRDYK